jgi:hypothetical protein
LEFETLYGLGQPASITLLGGLSASLLRAVVERDFWTESLNPNLEQRIDQSCGMGCSDG